MAATNFTPISLYYSATASAVPLAANLVAGELALNTNDGKLYYKNSSNVVTLLAGATSGPAGGSNTQVQFNSSGVLAGSANMTFNGTILTVAGLAGPLNGTVGATTPAAGTFTSLSDSGNLTFTGTGNRITGDFSNATVANRVMFQTSTTNGNTVINLIPNGTGTVCAFGMDTDPALTNSSTASFNLVASTDVRLSAGIRGTGTYLPMTFYTGGSERARIDINGLTGFGTASATSMLQTAGSSSVSAFKTPNIAEVDTISATAATGTINYDVTTQSVLYYTSNASGNFTVNFRGSSGTSLNTVMSTGESLSATFLVTNGSTAYYNSAVTIDGTSVTPKWQGGSAPTSGNASSIDSYTYVIQKTGSATYVVLASQTKFA